MAPDISSEVKVIDDVEELVKSALDIGYDSGLSRSMAIWALSGKLLKLAFDVIPLIPQLVPVLLDPASDILLLQKVRQAGSELYVYAQAKHAAHPVA